METMKPININSHFELVNALELPKKRIVQIWPEKVYKNPNGFAVFLCEVENEKGVDNGKTS